MNLNGGTIESDRKTALRPVVAEQCDTSQVVPTSNARGSRSLEKSRAAMNQVWLRHAVTLDRCVTDEHVGLFVRHHAAGGIVSCNQLSGCSRDVAGGLEPRQTLASANACMVAVFSGGSVWESLRRHSS